VTPDAGHLEAVRQVVEELGLDDQSFAWVGPASGIGDEAQLLDEAWDLASVEELYTTFLRLFEARAPETGTGSFVAQVELVQEWRRFPFLDPDLPRELLDPGWPGLRASELFHDQHQRWHRRAQAEWDRMDQTAAGKA
jgi:phenylacetic acid degradation operon negative regulatory protein